MIEVIVIVHDQESDKQIASETKVLFSLHDRMRIFEKSSSYF